MTDKSTSKEYDEELVIGKITDLTSSVIGFVIVLLNFLKIKVPKTAENPIGIIILLISIYSTGGLFKIEFSIPMTILYFIIIIVFLEIVAYNKPKISQIFSRYAKAEKIINKIKDGALTPDEAYYEIFRFNFDADNIEVFNVIIMTQSCDFNKLQDHDHVTLCPRFDYQELIETHSKLGGKGGWKNLINGRFVGMHLLNEFNRPPSGDTRVSNCSLTAFSC